MSSYLRLRREGGQYFFTARLSDRQGDLLTRHVDVLRAAFRDCRARHPFSIDAIVVLPAAVHSIWTLPPGDADFSRRWSLIKTRFSKAMDLPEHRRASQVRRGEKGIWQRRFWEHLIRSQADFLRHRDLVHNAPVVAGLVEAAHLWPWSSLHRENAPRLAEQGCRQAAPHGRLLP